MKIIVSRDNPRFKALKKRCRDRRERHEVGCIVLDGLHLLQSYTARFGAPEDVFVSESGCRKAEIADFLAQSAPVRVTQFPDALFGELATVETPSGIMALAALPPVGACRSCGDVVLLDGIQDPGNVGSILRTAAAAGFRQILLSADCAQVWSPKVLRAAMGAHFTLELHENVNLPEFLATYQGKAILTTLDKTADLLHASDLGQALGWVFGNEGQGVRAAVAQAAKWRVRIPMPGGMESLNVAAAAAICLFETLRQRQFSCPER